MDDDELKGLLGAPQEGSEVASGPAPEPAPAEPAAGGPERGADGKFVARAADVAEAAPAAATPAPAPAEPPPPAHVPITAMLDERDKRQALEKRLAELEARRAPPPPLEPHEQLQAALYAQNLKVSRRFADRQYGPELVATVHDWAARRCDEDPHFNTQMRTAEDPYEAAMQAYNRDQILAAVKPGDLDAFRAWQAAQAQTQAPNPNPASPSPAAPSPAIPRSLANASGSGGAGRAHVPVGEGMAFAATIKG
jgi:hypothetical protein